MKNGTQTLWVTTIKVWTDFNWESNFAQLDKKYCLKWIAQFSILQIKVIANIQYTTQPIGKTITVSEWDFCS